jgi:hypothetical protein
LKNVYKGVWICSWRRLLRKEGWEFKDLKIKGVPIVIV